MQAGEFSDEDFVRGLAGSGARALVIGRKALIHEPNRSPDEARRVGWYVLENGEHVDVMVARAKTDSEGHALDFESAWSRRQTIEVAPGVAIHLPSLDDLITTKRWASRPRDIVDIQYIEQLRQRRRA